MNSDKPSIGSILWRDLTVSNADEIQQFYCNVVGWTSEPHSMGDYHDFNIKGADDQTVAGICHARGVNADLPPQWLMYIVVEDAAASAERCATLGGKVVAGPRMMGNGKFCVIQDPAGAVVALISY